MMISKFLKNTTRKLNLGLLLVVSLLLNSCSTIHKNGIYQTKRYSFAKHKTKEVNKRQANRNLEHILAYRSMEDLRINASPFGLTRMDKVNFFGGNAPDSSKKEMVETVGQLHIERINQVFLRRKTTQQVVALEKISDFKINLSEPQVVSDSLKQKVKSELKPHWRTVGILSIIGAALIGITIAMNGLILGVMGVYLLLLIPLYIMALLAIRRHKYSKNTKKYRNILALSILASVILTFASLGASLYSLSILAGYLGGALLIHFFTLLIANYYSKSTVDTKRRKAILMSIGAFVVSALYVVLTYGMNSMG